MKRTLFGTCILASLLVGGAHWAARPANADDALDDQDVDVGRSARAYRVAITADGKLGELLTKNARLSSGFEIIDRRSLPAALVKANSFDAAKWGSTGADVVIMATASGAQIKMQMYEVSEGGKASVARGYPASDPLKAADKFMNDVVEHFTGKRGVFGSRIAFVRTRRNPTVSKNIQTVEMNGESAAGITSNRSLNILPSIGPSGQVLFTSYAKRNPDLWMGTGGAPKRVSSYPGLNLGGVMSPDGGTIAVALSKDGNSEIYSMDTGGNLKSRLTKNSAIDGSPSFGPGGQIAFVSSRSGGPQVFRMSSSGGGGTRVTKKGNYNQSPDWCQDKDCAEWIVYSGRDNSNRYQIYKTSVKSGKTETLTASPGRNLDPSWSPDGRLVAYYKDGGIYVANEKGNNQVQVAKGGTTPDWGPRANGY